MFCRGCERWSSPPTAWVNAQPESRELLGKLSSAVAWSQLTLSTLPQKDLPSPPKGPTYRRRLHLDRTPFPPD